MPILKQGIVGNVEEFVGNLMPSKNAPPPSATPIATTVYVYSITNITQTKKDSKANFYTIINTKLIDSCNSNAEGKFSVSLPEGKYSLFVKINGILYSNGFDEKNNIHPVIVEKEKVTNTKITITANAVF